MRMLSTFLFVLLWAGTAIYADDLPTAEYLKKVVAEEMPGIERDVYDHIWNHICVPFKKWSLLDKSYCDSRLQDTWKEIQRNCEFFKTLDPKITHQIGVCPISTQMIKRHLAKRGINVAIHASKYGHMWNLAIVNDNGKPTIYFINYVFRAYNAQIFPKMSEWPMIKKMMDDDHYPEYMIGRLDDLVEIAHKYQYPRLYYMTNQYELDDPEIIRQVFGIDELNKDIAKAKGL